MASANRDSPKGVLRERAVAEVVVVRAQPSEASASLKVCEGRITADALSSSGR
jgi:hypothetical protein